jgi:CBS domain-containing protein
MLMHSIIEADTGAHRLSSFEQACVGDAMRRWLITAEPATPLVTAAQRMADEHVHVLVVPSGTRRRRPWTLLTDHDILRSAARADELTAGEAASGELLEVGPEDRLADVAARMLERRVTHALVVDPDTDRPVGVLSTLDIARIVGWGRP